MQKVYIFNNNRRSRLKGVIWDLSTSDANDDGNLIFLASRIDNTYIKFHMSVTYPYPFGCLRSTEQ